MYGESLGDAELAVLGAVIATAGECLDEITLTGEDFNEPSRGDVFDSMLRMRASGSHIDLVTVMDANPKQSLFVASLINHAPFSYAVHSYTEIVAVHSMRRKLATVGATIASFDPTMSLTDMTDKARALVDDAVGQQKSRVRFVRDILPGVIERMKAEDVFTPSPWHSLNLKIGGLRPGAVYVVAARPGMGKTVIAGQLATQLAKSGMVAFSSLEMTEDELVARLVAERAEIMVGHVKDAQMTSRDWAKFDSHREILDGLNIAIDDRSGVAPGDIRTFARTVSRHGKLAGVVVDYMQLMTSKSKADRHIQVSEFSRQLKIMAKDLQVPVIALSQLNRNSESSTLAVPKMSDLRESGAIEQDADVIILLRREGEYPNESLVLDVAKNRHGETGEVTLAWQGEFSRAVEWSS